MTYRKNTFWNKPLPRHFGLIVLLLTLGTIFWLSRNVVIFQSRASLGNTPKDVNISNITENSATISYITDSSVVGSVSYGKTSSLDQVALDVRDTGSPTQHAVHYINISGLEENTKYFFSIASGDKVFQNGNVPYEFKTATIIQGGESKTLKIGGKATLDGTKAPTEAVMYVKSDESQLTSALINPDGGYKLEIKKLLKTDLSGIFDYKEDSIFKMSINDSLAESNITFFANYAASIPPIILPNNYDFTISQASATVSSESAKIPEFPVLEVGTETSLGPQILNPTSNEKFEDQQPLFEGRALPQSDVEIIIESEDPITTTVQADESGNWQFRPDTKLTPGEHKITIKTLNAEGILQTLTRSFTVNAQGSQFVEPSVSPTSGVTMTPTASPAPTISIATPTPTITILPTATVQPTIPPITPTNIVIAPTTVITTPSAISPTSIITIPPIPDSGSSAVIFGIIGTILTIGIGGLIFLLL